MGMTALITSCLQDAGQIAGLDVKRIINEPTAAARESTKHPRSAPHRRVRGQ